MRRFGRWLYFAPGRLFPKETDEPRTSSGYASDVADRGVYGLLAVLIAAAFGIFWLWMVRTNPLPPGDDPSTWMLTAYAYLGLPVPATAQPFGYPPATFPLLGLSVLAGGGPAIGGRIFMVGLILGLGLATYVLGRSLLTRPSLALLVEGLALAEPDFLQIFYFGGYPNLFAFIFFILSVAYLVRFLRSRQASHATYFWVSAALCVLSHSLTAVFLAGLLAFLALALATRLRLPRTILLSRGGAVGTALFAAAVGGYYAITYLYGVQHPSYLETGSGTSSKTNLIPTVLFPFYLNVGVPWFTHVPWGVSPFQTVEILGGACAAILAAFLLTRIARPAWLTTSWLVLAAWFLSVFAGTIVGYERSIQTDYRRFPYYLYLPVILTVVYPLDLLLTGAMGRDWAKAFRSRESKRAGRLPAPSARRPRAMGTPRWRRWVDPFGVVATVLLLLAASYYYTEPAAENYEAFYTSYAHDAGFVSAIEKIIKSGIPGNIVSSTPIVGRWPSTLSGDRATFVPSVYGSNAYVPQQIENGELTAVSVTNRYTVDNGLVAGSIPGIRPGQFNASPVYGSFLQNVYNPLLQVPTASLVIDLIGPRGTVTAAPVGSAAPPIAVLPGGLGYRLIFNASGFVLNETVTVSPGTPSLTVTLTATATGSANLAYLQARIATYGLVTVGVTPGLSSGEFVWNSSTHAGNFTTYGNVTPTTALSKFSAPNASIPVATTVLLHENSTDPLNGSRSLTMSLVLSTPGSSNVIATLPTWISAPSVWTNFSAGFLIVYNGSAGLGPYVTPGFYVAEYGAAVLTWQDPWIVLVLPTTLAGYGPP
jgi:hypothetical protein